MLREVAVSPVRQAALASAVQGGFVIGAVGSAFFGLADRFDPRRVFAVSAVAAGVANALLLVAPVGSAGAIAARAVTGALLAGVYPVGMKIAAGWGQRDRGFLLGALVGALTLGSAAPHLLALLGGAAWRWTIASASGAAIGAGCLALLVGLGPYHARAARFDPRAITQVWTNRRVRLAYGGYLGHMWELYAMWAWIGAAMTASFAVSRATADAVWLGRVVAFCAIGVGGVSCAVAGKVADRIGRAELTLIAMAISGACAVASGLAFGGPVWLSFAIAVLWGASVVPDSAQFSALVADASPPALAGSFMTLQTALGFALTCVTVQVTPVLAGAVGWPWVLALLGAGPAFGIIAMLRLRALA
jgi:MFS family permease